jgi:hypothetical protein
MVIPLPYALRSFSTTWSSSPSFYVHSFMILLIISCIKSCGLVAISPCHLLLHHVCCLCLIQTTWHNGISNLVSLITKTKLGLSLGHASRVRVWGSCAMQLRDGLRHIRLRYIGTWVTSQSRSKLWINEVAMSWTIHKSFPCLIY